jgi:hypothetical protein
MEIAASPARGVAGTCHREERSDAATSMTERTFGLNPIGETRK